MINKLAAAFVVAASVLGFVPSANASLIIGLPADVGAGNQFPFGGNYTGEYQQVYTSSAFAGPITISDLEFFNTQFDSGATAIDSGTYTISLSTTSADWNTLSPTFASNIGADNTVVFSGDLSQPWAFGNTLHIDLSTLFSYDPSQGNLLLDVSVSGASSQDGTIFFDVNTGLVMGRVYLDGGSGTTSVVNSGYGLVTGFSTSDVPEPSTVALIGMALLSLFGLGLMRRHNDA